MVMEVLFDIENNMKDDSTRQDSPLWARQEIGGLEFFCIYSNDSYVFLINIEILKMDCLILSNNINNGVRPYVA
jgi:hypothetical protein